MFDPWHKTTLSLRFGPHSLQFRVPHDVFATREIDAGTRLLLDHLPSGEPGRVLDLGCGYGALGLPVAARFPGARVELVDRDLLAVEWARKNAIANELANARAYPSLGFHDLRPGGGPYHWILCNVPARIGRAFIAHLFEASAGRLLAPGGAFHAVVIRDLAPVIDELARARSGGPERIAQSATHAVYALPARAWSAGPDSSEDPLALYGRDEIRVAGLALARPLDLGGDDPKRLRAGLPTLLEAWPRAQPEAALFLRCGYGVLPLAARARWPGARVVAVDRDLLATAFTRLNASRLTLGGPLLEVREAAHLPDALAEGERFGFAAFEISPGAGQEVAELEVAAVHARLSPGGQALLLMLEKLWRAWIEPAAARRKWRLTRLLSREGWCVARLAR